MECPDEVFQTLPQQMTLCLEAQERPTTSLVVQPKQEQPVPRTSAPSSPTQTLSTDCFQSRAIFHSPISDPCNETRFRRQKLVYDSPRLSREDSEIFPDCEATFAKWRLPDDRWRSLADQAGEHRQDGKVCKISKRIRNPSAVRYGFTATVASRVEELHLPMDREYKASLCAWMDVVAETFKNLKHIHLLGLNNEESHQSGITLRVVENRDSVADVWGASTNAGDSPNGFIYSGTGISPTSRIANIETFNTCGRRPSYGNSRLYVLFRLPKLISINGKIVTVSERLAQPNQDEKLRQQHMSSPVADEFKHIIHAVDPISIRFSSKGYLADRSDWFVRPATANVTSLLDATENEDDETYSDVPDQFFEVSLSGPINELREDNLKATTCRKNCTILPSLVPRRSDLARGAMAALADLDGLEYSSTATSSVACEWSAACGSLTFPYFRRSRLLNSDSVSSSTTIATTEKIQERGATDKNIERNSKTLTHSVFKRSEKSQKTGSRKSKGRKVRKQGRKESAGMWILKSNGALVSLATNTTGEVLKSNSSLQHNSDDNSTETTHGRIGSFSGLESQEEQEYVISITKCETTKHNHAKSSTPLRSYKDTKSHTVNRRSTSQTPGPSSAMKRATSPKFRIPPSHSLASPFPMQFRVRATAPAASDTPLTMESNFTTINALSVRTEFGIDDEIQDQPSPPPPPPSRFSPTISTTSSIDSEVKSGHGTLDTLPSYPIQLTRTHSYPSNVLECYKTSPSPRKAMFSDSRPPCPGYSRRKLLSPAPPLESDPQSRRFGRRKKSASNLEWHDKDMARSNSILDDYDDDENDESTFDDLSCQSALSEAGDVSSN